MQEVGFLSGLLNVVAGEGLSSDKPTRVQIARSEDGPLLFFQRGHSMGENVPR